MKFLSGAASFPGFAWPKTALKPGTERSLTSEFGMGSGGSRALWPANPKIHVRSLLINFSLVDASSFWGFIAKLL